MGLRPAPEVAWDLRDDGAVGWAGCLRPSRWLSPFQGVEEARNAEGGPGCMLVTEAAVVMEGLGRCPEQVHPPVQSNPVQHVIPGQVDQSGI